MKYTFLLPAYKSRFIEEALRSIQNQTYKDFKVIVSDDCSPEDIKSIVDKFTDDSRIKYRRNAENMGSKSLVSHWNLLVDMCDTEYLIMASDDDVYAPNFLEEIDRLSTKYPDVDLIHARAKVIDEHGNVIKHDAMYEEIVSQIEFLAFWGKKDHVECIANYAYKTKRLRQIGGFVDYPLAWASDAATNNLMAKKGVASTTKMLFNFRMSGSNLSCIGNEDKNIVRKKLQAAFLFDKQSERLFSSFKPDGTKLYEHQIHMAKESQMLVVSTTVWAHSSILTLKELLKCISFMKKKKYITTRYEIYKMFARWILSKTQRLL